MIFIVAALLIYGLVPEVAAASTSAPCPAPVGGKIPVKCGTCFSRIIAQINKTTVLDPKVMYGFANFIGVYVEQWIKNRTTAGNNAVPTMCEIGNAIKDYVSSHLNELIACVGQYNQATAGTVASDAAQIMLVVGSLNSVANRECSSQIPSNMNNYNLDEIANGATCGAMSCLQAAYNNGLVPIYKAWISNKANYTTIQNQVCVLCVNYVSTATVGKCFENIKARTRVAVLTNLYDKYVPHYFGLYQHYRDVSTVACMTKSLQCGCNITVNATQANQAASAAASG